MTARKNKLHHIVIVGSGPRGLSILERLAVLITEKSHINIHISLVDAFQLGCGRIWRTDQPDWFLMNTVADEVSSFSGQPDNSPARPGAGPSLAQWWRSVDPNYPGPNSYAPRALHGQYMQFVLSTIEASLNLKNVVFNKIKASVIDLDQQNNEIILTLSDKSLLTADKVILTTGHSIYKLDDNQEKLSHFASTKPALQYIRGDSAADMDLSNITSSSSVGIIGLGLSFYDVIAALTIGRGGKFIDAGNDMLTYISSGYEPILIGGSRSGVPVLARGKNQKDPNYRYCPVIFTHDIANKLRKKGPVNFKEQVLPLLLAEINLVYYETIIKNIHSDFYAKEFRNKVKNLGYSTTREIVELSSKYEMHKIPELDLNKITDPFYGKCFSNPHEFHENLIQLLNNDLEDSLMGNVDSPIKAALDVIRDSRAIIRKLVDYGGLTSQSYQTDFINWYTPKSSFLAAGPPRFRVQQIIALIKSGVLHIIGPKVNIVPDANIDSFMISSPQVNTSSKRISVVIDARIPFHNMMMDESLLTKNLIKKGIWIPFINKNGPEEFMTGGVSVSSTPFHPIDQYKLPNRNLYVLGIPTEHTRWFMQAGSSRPGFWTDFVTDADAIASDALLPTDYVSKNILPYKNFEAGSEMLSFDNKISPHIGNGDMVGTPL